MTDQPPVAIVGIGGVFPGASSLDEFWENIASGESAAKEVPAGRWFLSPEAVYDPRVPAPDKVYSTRGCFVDGFRLDTDGLDLDTEVLDELDPVFHLALHAANGAFRDANLHQVDLERVGVIIGNIVLPTETTSAMARASLGSAFEEKVLDSLGCSPRQRRPSFPNVLNRAAAGLPGGLIAKAFGLGGGALTLDAACASSLYALHLAVREIQAGRADAMLTGGVSRPDCLYTQMGFSQLRALSPSGRCSPFDQNADGLVVGEGAGIFVLKRLDDAIARGDRIYAVIKSVGLSNDVGGSLLAPNSEGQLRAMRAAYASADWEPSSIDLIECHATGTPVGDAVELASLRELWGATASGSKKKADWRRERCVIGSVKSNIGHLLTGAGAAGLMKVLLAFERRLLPPTANFSTPTQREPLSESPFEVLQERQPWERRDGDTPRRAAVSAFGFGGINAHVLLEEWHPPASTASETSSAPSVVSSSDVAPNDRSHRDARSVPEGDCATPIAIVGMEAYFGDLTTLAAFKEHVLSGGRRSRQRRRSRWFGVEDCAWFQERGDAPETFDGHLIDALDVPLDRFRIPPKELAEMLPQQLLMLQVAARAIEDARLSQDIKLQTGVFIGIGLDLNTTNFHFRWSIEREARKWVEEYGVELDEQTLRSWIDALRTAAGPALTANRTMGALGGIVASRIAREFQIGGPSFTISSEETSGIRAFEMAVRALELGELDQAVVGAVDFPGEVRDALATHARRRFSATGHAQPFSPDADGATVGEGAAAVILKRLDHAERDGDHVYSIIRGVGVATAGGCDDLIPSSEAYRNAMRRALAEARLEPGQIGYVEVHAGGHPEEDRRELTALADVYAAARENKNPCLLGSVKGVVGHTGAASGLAALVKVSLCLDQEIIAGFPITDTPTPELAEGLGGLVLPAKPQYWLRDRIEGPRRAALTAASVDGNCVHIILEGYDKTAGPHSEPKLEPSFRQPLGARDNGLFVIEGVSPRDLLDGIEALKLFAENSSSLGTETLARRWWAERRPDASMPLAVALVAESRDDLLALLEQSRGRLSRGSGRGVSGAAVSAHADSFFYSPEPCGFNGRVAFVYPGSGNHYPSAGRQISVEWPELLRRQDRQTERLASQVLGRHFWNAESPGRTTRLGDAGSMLQAQVAFGSLATDLVRRFGVEPRAAIGYSLGETTALFALRAWTDRDLMLRRMAASPLFKTELAGPCLSARKTWNLPSPEEVDWVAGIVDCPAAVVNEVIKGRSETKEHERVYVLIVNTPEECVVGGQRAAVELLVNALSCQWIPFENSTTVHCEVLDPVASAYRQLHLLPVTPPPDVRYYSGAYGDAYDLTDDSAADAILAQARHGINFPAVIERAYKDGVRVFVELGPQASCTRLIRKTLGDRTHVARSAFSAKESESTSVLRLLGNLIAERVPVDLTELYGGSTPCVGHATSDDRAPPEDRRGPLTVPIGGEPFVIPPPPEVRPRPMTLVEPPALAAQLVASPNAELDDRLMHTGFDNPPQSDIPAFDSSETTFSNPLTRQLVATQGAQANAHATFLRLSSKMTQTAAQQISLEMLLLESSLAAAGEDGGPGQLMTARNVTPTADIRPALFDRPLCLEFAVGSIARVLGPEFAVVDSYPTRVRLPDEPLMLVDRILLLEGEPRSLGSGRVVTEHDVLPGGWYLDGGHLPTAVAVEAGQADLFLSAYLGIDFQTKGLAVYRLLDAIVTFHRGLPAAGETVRYDIQIDEFFRQGESYLFRFRFEGTIDGDPFLSMKNGCAGFFTSAELAAGGGVVQTRLDQARQPGVRPHDWRNLVVGTDDAAEVEPGTIEAYDEAQIEALRHGDLAGCFGEAFANVELTSPLRLPSGLLKLVDRVPHLEIDGGRFGLGMIRAEADIHPDDWFLTCHFVDDQVMPGTLMYECCLHTLRVFLLRMGWVGEETGVICEPVPGVSSQLKCRGQVIASTRRVTYEVTPKEIGYGPAPYAIADALMFADDKPIVEIRNMSIRFDGWDRETIEALWERGRARTTRTAPARVKRKAAIFDHDRILAFAIGKPSEAFGEPYKVFDKERIIARLPGPPYQFLDRVTRIDAEPWRMISGGEIEAEYDIPVDAWYFGSNRQSQIPFAILLEIALQPCGWLAGYVGSALTSPEDLSFRNLGGNAILAAPVTPTSGTLTTRVKMTRASSSGGMIIQHYDFDVRSGNRSVYAGSTHFGFFSKLSLAEQVGIRDATPYQASTAEHDRGRSFGYPRHAPFPDDKLRMVEEIDLFVADGGPAHLGSIRGTKEVRNDEWFFKAHFYQDPVWPGSLGLEAFVQLLKVAAHERWAGESHADSIHFDTIGLDAEHRWVYRGQVIPNDRCVTVDAVITALDDRERLLRADGFLTVDGRIIYEMHDFTARMTTGHR